MMGKLALGTPRLNAFSFNAYDPMNLSRAADYRHEVFILDPTRALQEFDRKRRKGG
jgi:hypothetical protein